MQQRPDEVNRDTLEQKPTALNFTLRHPAQTEGEGTAATSVYLRFAARAGEQDTFIAFSEGMGESLMKFALSFIEAVVQDQLKRRTRLLENENSLLRERLANLPSKRKSQFRLPENFWEEEPEPV